MSVKLTLDAVNNIVCYSESFEDENDDGEFCVRFNVELCVWLVME